MDELEYQEGDQGGVYRSTATSCVNPGSPWPTQHVDVRVDRFAVARSNERLRPTDDLKDVPVVAIDFLEDFRAACTGALQYPRIDLDQDHRAMRLQHARGALQEQQFCTFDVAFDEVTP